MTALDLTQQQRQVALAKPMQKQPYSRQPRPISLLRALAFMLLALIGFSLSTSLYAQSDNTAARKTELKALLNKLKSVQQRLEKHQGQKQTAELTFRKTELDIGALAKQQHQLQQQQAKLQKQRSALAAEQAELGKRAEQQQMLIASHIRTAYQVGKPNPISVMLSHKNPASADRQLIYFDYINRARTRQLQAFQAIIDEKRQVTAAISDKERSIADNIATLAKQKQQLMTLLVKREGLLQQLDKDIGRDQQQISSLNSNRQNLQTLLDEMSKVVNAQPAETISSQSFIIDGKTFNQAKGKLPWPVDGKLHNYFGRKRTGSDIKWQGVTIDAKSGKPVRAIYPGTVIFADWFKGQGLLMIVDHGRGYWSLYGRNQSLLQEVGTMVSAGETIATVGNSGGRGSPALYFEIRHNGQPSNPKQWCSRS